MRLKAENIYFRYSENKPWLLDNVNIKIESGEKIGIVGASGGGKSTLAKILSAYIRPNKGQVIFNSSPLPISGFCPVQLIHQHPELSVNPRLKMERILNEFWTPDPGLVNSMGIKKEWLLRHPHELSGGELQRFCIARVLSPKTKFLICDEITSMLDTITQAQIWRIVMDFAKKNNIGMIVITHNMNLAKRICDRIVELE